MIDLRFKPLDKPVQPPKSGHGYKSPYSIGWSRLLDELEIELDALKAENIVVEGGFSRHQIRNDGWPAGGASPTTPGIRLSFYSRLVGAPLAYECARFAEWQANLRAIGLTLQRLRLIDVLGTSPRGEQYRGWAALPPGGLAMSEWANVSEARTFLASVGKCAAGMQIDSLYRCAAKYAHPDAGGSDDLMAKVTRAKAYVQAGEQ